MCVPAKGVKELFANWSFQNPGFRDNPSRATTRRGKGKEVGTQAPAFFLSQQLCF